MNSYNLKSPPMRIFYTRPYSEASVVTPSFIYRITLALTSIGFKMVENQHIRIPLIREHIGKKSTNKLALGGQAVAEVCHLQGEYWGDLGKPQKKLFTLWSDHLEGGGEVRALVIGPLRKDFFAASLMCYKECKSTYLLIEITKKARL